MTDEEFKVFSEKVDRGEKINREISIIKQEIDNIKAASNIYINCNHMSACITNTTDMRSSRLMAEGRIQYSFLQMLIITQLEEEIKKLREEFDSL